MAEIYELKELIKDLLTDFIRLLCLLPPKAHILTHYVELLLLLGPLILVWGMPFERKNRETKEVFVGTSSHKDLPFTIAVSNQRYMIFLRQELKKIAGKIELGKIINENSDEDF